MMIAELTYKKSLNEVENWLDAHNHFLQKYYDAGLFLASGAKIPRDGGFIFAMTDADTFKAILTEDPFYQHEIAEYRIREFNPSRYAPAFREMLDVCSVK